MNTRTNKTVLLIILMICLATAVYSAVGTFTFRTSGASDTTEVVDLRYPQKVPEDASVTTDSIADGSITNDKLAEPVSVANGGTGKTTAAEALAALGGASLNGSSTVDFSAKVSSRNPGAVSGVTEQEVELSADEIISLGDAIPTAPSTYQNGILEIYDFSVVRFALFNLRGGQEVTDEILDSADFFSVTKDTPFSVNVYFEGTTVKIQNKRTSTATLLLSYRGLRQ